MSCRHVPPLLVLLLVGTMGVPACAAEALAPVKPNAVDPLKAKAKELEKQRLIARLHADAPKVVDLPSGTNPLDAPIFHRYDRP